MYVYKGPPTKLVLLEFNEKLAGAAPGRPSTHIFTGSTANGESF